MRDARRDERQGRVWGAGLLTLALVSVLVDRRWAPHEGGACWFPPAFALLTLAVLTKRAFALEAAWRSRSGDGWRGASALAALVLPWGVGAVAQLNDGLRPWVALPDGARLSTAALSGIGLSLAALLVAALRRPIEGLLWLVLRRNMRAARGAPALVVVALVAWAVSVAHGAWGALRSASLDDWYTTLPVVARWVAGSPGAIQLEGPLEGLRATYTRPHDGSQAGVVRVYDRSERVRLSLHEGAAHRSSTAPALPELRYDAAARALAGLDGFVGVSAVLIDASGPWSPTVVDRRLRAGTLSAPRGWLLVALEGPLFALWVVARARRRRAALRVAAWSRLDRAQAAALSIEAACVFDAQGQSWVRLGGDGAVAMRGATHVIATRGDDPWAEAAEIERDACLHVAAGLALTGAPLAVVLLRALGA